MNSETNTKPKLLITDKFPLISAIVASIPFHILLFFGVLKAGVTLLTFLYLCLNAVIVYCMFNYFKYLFKDKNIAIKKLLYFEIIPALIISILLASWGKSNRPLDQKFLERMEKYFSGRHSM